MQHNKTQTLSNDTPNQSLLEFFEEYEDSGNSYGDEMDELEELTHDFRTTSGSSTDDDPEDDDDDFGTIDYSSGEDDDHNTMSEHSSRFEDEESWQENDSFTFAPQTSFTYAPSMAEQWYEGVQNSWSLVCFDSDRPSTAMNIGASLTLELLNNDQQHCCQLCYHTPTQTANVKTATELCHWLMNGIGGNQPNFTQWTTLNTQDRMQSLLLPGPCHHGWDHAICLRCIHHSSQSQEHMATNLLTQQQEPVCLIRSRNIKCLYPFQNGCHSTGTHCAQDIQQLVQCCQGEFFGAQHSDSAQATNTNTAPVTGAMNLEQTIATHQTQHQQLIHLFPHKDILHLGVLQSKLGDSLLANPFIRATLEQRIKRHWFVMMDRSVALQHETTIVPVMGVNKSLNPTQELLCVCIECNHILVVSVRSLCYRSVPTCDRCKGRTLFNRKRKACPTWNPFVRRPAQINRLNRQEFKREVLKQCDNEEDEWHDYSSSQHGHLVKTKHLTLDMVCRWIDQLLSSDDVLSECSLSGTLMCKTTACNLLEYNGVHKCYVTGRTAPLGETLPLDHWSSEGTFRYDTDDYWQRVGCRLPCKDGVCRTDTHECTLPCHAAARGKYHEERRYMHLSALMHSLPVPLYTCVYAWLMRQCSQDHPRIETLHRFIRSFS